MQEGVPDQTLISSVLHKVVSGRLLDRPGNGETSGWLPRSHDHRRRHSDPGSRDRDAERKRVEQIPGSVQAWPEAAAACRLLRQFLDARKHLPSRSTPRRYIDALGCDVERPSSHVQIRITKPRRHVEAGNGCFTTIRVRCPGSRRNILWISQPAHGSGQDVTLSRQFLCSALGTKQPDWS